MVCTLGPSLDSGCEVDDSVDCGGSEVMVSESAGEDADANIEFSKTRPRFGVDDSVPARERS
jgi:hypothetical protein